MAERQLLVEKLVSELHLNVAERNELGREPILLSEVASAILRMLTNSGRFPPNAAEWQPGGAVFEGHFLRVLAEGTVRLSWQRAFPTNPYQVADQGHLDFPNQALGVEEFIKREWPGKNVDGIPFEM
jgi:hypothetical protein